MSFLTPLAAILGILAIPMVIAFLHQRRAAERVAPSLVLLRRLKTDVSSQKRFALPRHLLALALYLLALAAVIFAAASPILEGHEPRTVWIVVDASASMATQDEGSKESRLERAVERFEQEVLPELSWLDEVGVVVTGAERRVALEPTRRHAQILDVMKAITPAGIGAPTEQALQLAHARCRGEEHGAILWITDAQQPVEATKEGAGCPVHVLDVGKRSENVAITEFATRASDALGQREIFIEVLNTGAEERVDSVDVSLDGILLEVVAVRVGAKTSAGKLVRVEDVPGGVARAEVRTKREDGNALPNDDVAVAPWGSNRLVRVLLVTSREASYVAEALSLHPRVDLVRAAPDTLGDDPVDLIVLEDEPTVALPPAGHVIALGRGLGAVGIEEAKKLERPEVTWWSFDSELLRYVDLDALQISDSPALEAPAGSEALVRAGEHVLALAHRHEGRDIVAFGFHPDRSDLVMQVAFVNFIANVVEWTGALEDDREIIKLRTGERLAGVADGDTLLPMWEGEGALDATEPVREAGAWTWRDETGNERGLVVVNLLSAGESRLGPKPLDDALVEPVAEGGDDWVQEWLWRAALMLAVLLLGAEMLVPAWRKRRKRIIELEALDARRTKNERRTP